MKKYCKIKKKEQKKVLRIMCRASELAKYTINACLDMGYKIDTPKLQKLLTIMQGEYLAEYGKVLFPEPIEVWECGVAIRRVNDDFKSYILGITEHQECYLALLDNEKYIIHNVLEKFGSFDVFELNQDPKLMRIKNEYYEKDNSVVVPPEFIRKVFAQNECIS